VSTRPKGSLKLVGEFFEVRTQVDRDLTIVSRVDRRLGLIKNLGRHSLEIGDFGGLAQRSCEDSSLEAKLASCTCVAQDPRLR
jgi:hypothetical protein